MKFGFQAIATIEVNHQKETNKSTIEASQILLDCSPNLDKKAYINRDGSPTKAGTRAITNTFVQGLICNIHNSHKDGKWNDAEHIRYIIDELQKGFVAQVKAETGEFKPVNKIS